MFYGGPLCFPIAFKRTGKKNTYSNFTVNLRQFKTLITRILI